jgi:hypothetical protein
VVYSDPRVHLCLDGKQSSGFGESSQNFLVVEKDLLIDLRNPKILFGKSALNIDMLFSHSYKRKVVWSYVGLSM